MPNNEPAFPRPYSTDEHDRPCNGFDEQSGMTLRDYFAGQALAGMCASEWYSDFANEGDDRSKPMCSKTEGAVRQAYRFADTMLAVRSVQKESI